MLASLAALLAALAACAKPAPEWTQATGARADVFEWALVERDGSVLPPGSVRVQLAFGGSADLDLYVTDVLQETVYFGNSPSRSGGTLEADRRCDDAVPRVETIVFPDALPGRYRVGIDYIEGCAADAGPVAFVLKVEHGGGIELTRRLIEPFRFEPIVHEFDVAARE